MYSLNIFFVGFMVSEIKKVSVFGHSPYSFTFHYRLIRIVLVYISIEQRESIRNVN